ncbi:glycosyltransferase family 2 protein [Geothrix campi]|uniref:glycosyltransferase family 2 protein n=1 Tax=Geothrix campi TaxID=2966450 RepID=UPI0021473B95|nr:glycosyltransferase family 2 protein [Geothrix sp. SG10]
MTRDGRAGATPAVGILVLNYHQPDSTLACIQSLLAHEGEETRILWIENDAGSAPGVPEALLASHGIRYRKLSAEDGALPEAGQIGLLEIPENLGYAGGNNVGLAYLADHDVPYAWVLNNDTLLLEGSCLDLVEEARRQPDVGLWGTTVATGRRMIVGGRLVPPTFHTEVLVDPAGLDDPLAFINGCSVFMRVADALSVGGIPPHYFLYYEDVAFSLLLRRQGKLLGSNSRVVVAHEESLSSGLRSAVVEYYNRRNRWFLIQEFFPAHLRSNQRRLAYQLQKYLFRFRFKRAWLEWAAYRDFKMQAHGRSLRDLRGRT